MPPTHPNIFNDAHKSYDPKAPARPAPTAHRQGIIDARKQAARTQAAKVAGRVQSPYGWQQLFAPTNTVAPGWRGFLARAADTDIGTSFLNKVAKNHKQTRNFKTIGEAISSASAKGFVNNLKTGAMLMGVLEYGLLGKELTASNLFESASHNLAYTVSAQLAGGFMRSTIWGLGGAAAGLSPWETVGLQALSMASPVAAAAAMGGIATYKGVSAMVNNAFDKEKLGKRLRQRTFQTPDLSYATQEAATMRQRSMAAIQNSHHSLRRVLGNEATLLAGR